LLNKKYLRFSLPVSLPALMGFMLSAVAAVNEPLFSVQESKSATAALNTRTDVQQFINEMVKKHAFVDVELHGLFTQVQLRDDILNKIKRPAEKSKPWYEYRKIFLDEPRIINGVAFWRQHQSALARASQIHGVAPEIIVAIIGVETRYGKVTGRDQVLEALATIAFGYPKRAPFFRSELEHYLLLTRSESIAPLSLTGSYAGAMGIAQFMPSSYRRYAVDFDNDQKRDLWHNPVDAIGSVANYLAHFGWRHGGNIVIPVQISGERYKILLSNDLKPKHNVAKLKQAGVLVPASVNNNSKAILLQLQAEQGPRYWLGFNNFYVISRYNRSPLYVMAVYELSREIVRRFNDN